MSVNHAPSAFQNLPLGRDRRRRGLASFLGILLHGVFARFDCLEWRRNNVTVLSVLCLLGSFSRNSGGGSASRSSSRNGMLEPGRELSSRDGLGDYVAISTASKLFSIWLNLRGVLMLRT